MAPITPGSSSLAHTGRDAHNLNYLVQVVRSQVDPAILAHGLLAVIHFIEIMLANPEQIDSSQIYLDLYPSVRRLYFPDYQEGANGKPKPGKFNRSAQKEDNRKTLTVDEEESIPHHCCTKCGHANARCETVCRHVSLIHIEESQGKEQVEIRDDHTDIFLPYWKENGSIPLILGRRDIAPIASDLKLAMKDIIANPNQVIPPPNEVLSPAPPPVSASVPSTVVIAAAPSPSAAPPRHNLRKSKRKADDDRDTPLPGEPHKRQRAADESVGTSKNASSSRTASVAASDGTVSSSTTIFAFPAAGIASTSSQPLPNYPSNAIYATRQPDLSVDTALPAPSVTGTSQYNDYYWVVKNFGPGPDAPSGALTGLGDGPQSSGFETSHSTASSSDFPHADASTSDNAAGPSLALVSSPTSSDGSSTALDDFDLNKIDPVLLENPYYNPAEDAGDEDDRRSALEKGFSGC